MTDPRTPIFAALRAARPANALTATEVAQIHDLCDRLRIPRALPDEPEAAADDITAAAIKHLRREEGERLTAYKDHLGYWTIGVGRLIDVRKGGRIAPGEERVLLANDPSRKPGKWVDWQLTTEESAYLLANDIARVRDQLATRLGLAPAWAAVRENPARAVALISMAFQMGAEGLDKFDTTLGLIAAGKFAEAAANARKSLWAKQTPARARRVTALLETGRGV